MLSDCRHIEKNVDIFFQKCDIVFEKSINATCTIVSASLCTTATRVGAEKA